MRYHEVVMFAALTLGRTLSSTTRLAIAGLLTGSADHSIKCVDVTGAVTWERAAAHATAVNVIEPFAGYMLATADDDGAVKIWDTRTGGVHGSPPIVELAHHDDVVTALLVDAARSTLLSASGDGTLGVVDLRKSGRLIARTEQEDDELLSLAVIKEGGTVVAGTQDGVLLSWLWGRWGGQGGSEDEGSARFTGHPQSVDALLAVEGDALATGSSDGLIRLVTVDPDKLVGVLGEHNGDEPVERLRWSRDRRIIGSSGHDETLRFWDVAYLFEEDDEVEEGNEGGTAASTGRGLSRFAALPALALPRASDERDAGGKDRHDDEDDKDDDEDEDSLEEEDDEDMGVSARVSGTAKGARSARGRGASKSKKGDARGSGGFFDDL